MRNPPRILSSLSPNPLGNQGNEFAQFYIKELIESPTIFFHSLSQDS
jgi:hypothetical protein